MWTSHGFLLQLPASLRQQALLHASPSFQTAHLLKCARSQATQAAPKRGTTLRPPKPRFKSQPLPPTELPSIRSPPETLPSNPPSPSGALPSRLPKPSRRPPTLRNTSIEHLQPPRSQTPNTPQSMHEYALKLTENGAVPIYISGAQTTFVWLSYVCGGSLVLSAVIWADSFRLITDNSIEMLARVGTVGFTVVTCASLGTALFLAPARLIRSIVLLPSSASQEGFPVFRVTVKRQLPFLGPKVFHSRVSEVKFERHTVEGKSAPVAIATIPKGEVDAYLEVAEGKLILKESPSLSQPSLQRAWDAIKRDTSRMFTRSAFRYTQFDSMNGSFKLDLHRCYMWEYGEPFFRHFGQGRFRRTSVLSWLGAFRK